MKRLILFLFLLAIFATTSAVFWGSRFLHYQAPQTTVVYFEKGSSLRKISLTLSDKKVISNPFLFEWMTRLKNKGGKLKAGEYEFTVGSNPSEVLRQMAAGEVKKYPFTIPEGFNLQNMGNLLSEKGVIKADEWQSLISDSSLLRFLPVTAASLEGYLFPDTYYFTKGMTGRELIERMISIFKEKVPSALVEKNQTLSLHQWVTLASLVEKETSAREERPLIANVFLNRLKIRMPLQTDPSVIYGIKNFNGNLTRNDLLHDTPYNTYTRAGLPPGPICSPGSESLLAVLNPAAHEYLYFVSKGDGSHYFSKTLEEHNRAVNYYQRGQGSLP